MSTDDSWKANHEATVASGTLAIRTMLLINGGAVLAVLGFIGGIAGQGRVCSRDLNQIAASLTPFGLGVVFVALATAMAYLANRAILATVGVPPTTLRNWRSGILQVLAALSVVLSLVAFMCGLFEIRSTIGSLTLIDPAHQSQCKK
jgi:hypothetical protein